jgi:hypothetical protein
VGRPEVGGAFGHFFGHGRRRPGRLSDHGIDPRNGVVRRGAAAFAIRRRPPFATTARHGMHISAIGDGITQGGRDMPDARDGPEPSGQDGPVVSAEERRWTRDLEKSQRTRLKRTQASARVWLGVLTSLLGLLGSVVLFKGGDLVTGVTSSGAWQVVLIILVSLVFGVTVLAVVFGGQATWGGLGDVTEFDEGDPGGDRIVGGRSARTRAGWRRGWFSLAELLLFRSGSWRAGHEARGAFLEGTQGQDLGER